MGRTTAPDTQREPADALGVTANACEAWAVVLDGVSPSTAATLRRAASSVSRARRVGQITASTATGLRGALAAALEAIKGNS